MSLNARAKIFILGKTEVGSAILPDDLPSPHVLDVPMKLLVLCRQIKMCPREVRDAETTNSYAMQLKVCPREVCDAETT